MRAISVARDNVRIGRLPTCEVVLEGNGVARYHALLERALDGSWTVVNMGSSGTCLNGHPVTALARAKVGDELTIGTYRLVFMDENAPEAQQLPPPPPPSPRADPPDMVLVPSEGELVAAPVARVLWSATAEEMNSEPRTGEVPIPFELIEPDEPIYLLTQRKRS